MLIISEDEVRQLISLADQGTAVDLVERAYLLKKKGEATLHPRQSVMYPPENGYYTDSVIRLLMGIIPDMDSAAMRIYANFHPNKAEIDPGSGPRVLDFTMRDEVLFYWRYQKNMELAAIMADYTIANIRTAAPSGVATRWMAPPDAKVFGCIGAGRHAPWQIAAACAVRQFDTVKIFSPTRANREACARTVAPFVKADVVVVDSAEAAVAGSDVVTTVTNANKPVINAEWIKPGAHVNIMSRGECDEATILKADHIGCSWREQILRDRPDFMPVPQLVRRGAISEDRFFDVDHYISPEWPAARAGSKLTLFLSQGVGLWDAATAAWVYQRAVEKGLGTEINFVRPV